jgi:16S rRNA (cytosine967-C5)-methyltransferase
MTARPDARSAAWEALRGVAAGKGDAEPLLRKLLAGTTFPPVERRLAFELTLGTLRKRGCLDYGLERYLTRPLRELHPDLRELLRLGAYQLLELDRVPAYAAVDRTVELARNFSTTRKAAGLVNAVLRRLSEGRPEPPDRDADPVGHLAVTGSHPRWLVKRWLERYGFDETARLCAVDNEPPDTFVFLNPFRAAVEDFREIGPDAEAVAGFPGCYRLARGADLTSSGAYAQGKVYAADPATSLAAMALDPRPGEIILDACSAPGGKLFHLHRLAGLGLKTVALEISPRRCAVLAENINRLGLPAAVVNGDLLLAPLARPRFDKILLDVPCSNTGVLRRRVEARWRRRPEDLKALARLQLDLLASASRLVKSGGLLAYSTCSLEPEENEGLVGRFLSGRGDFQRVPAALGLDDGLRGRFGDSGGDIRALPHLTGTDGAYVALMRRVR